MAKKGQVIVNRHSGQKIEFLKTSSDTDGKMLEMLSSFKPGSMRPPVHYHPFQKEVFYVLKGELKIRLNDYDFTVFEGETVEISRNMKHAMWNASKNETIVNWKVFPAMDTEHYLEKFMVMGDESKNGKPGLIKASTVLLKYWNSFRLAKPAPVLQLIILFLAAPFAFFMSMKNAVKKPVVLSENYHIAKG